MSSPRLQRAIEDPTLELKIVSASDVSHMDATDKMDVYAVVSLVGDDTREKQSAKTPIDYDGGSNPTWNHTVKFSVNERGAKEGVLTIKVKLFSYWLENENDLYIGEVNVSVQELLASNPIPPFANRNFNKLKSVTYPIKVIGEKQQTARLTLSYRFKPMLVNDLYPPPEPDYSPLFGQPIYSNSDPAISSHPIMYSPQLQTKCQTKLALELVIKHAKDIKKVNILDEMHVYASVTIREGEKTIKRSNTPIDFSAYQNPKWDHAVKFSLDEQLARDGRLTLFVELMSHRPLFGDKLIGEVNVLIQDLLGFNPLTNGDSNDMVLVTGDVCGSYGKKGKLSFTFRFLREKITVPKPPPSTNPQPFIMYLPISHQAYTSPDSGYVNVHPGSHAGPSNGLMPMYMAHEYQHYSPQQQQQQQSQPPPEKSWQPRPQPHSSQEQPQFQPQQQTQLEAQAQVSRPEKKRQGGSIAALGLGAAFLGRAIGGALISDMMMSDEVNMYEFEA